MVVDLYRGRRFSEERSGIQGVGGGFSQELEAGETLRVDRECRWMDLMRWCWEIRCGDMVRATSVRGRVFDFRPSPTFWEERAGIGFLHLREKGHEGDIAAQLQ